MNRPARRSAVIRDCATSSAASAALWNDPHVRDVEAALLGAAITYTAAARQLLADVDALDLADPTHRGVLAVITRMLAAGERPEPVLLAAALRRGAGSPHPTGRNWALVVADLVHAAGHPAWHHQYLHALLDARLRRETAAFAARLDHAASTGSSDAVNAALSAATSQLGLTLARLAETTPTRAEEPNRAPSRNRLGHRRATTEAP